MLKYRNYTDSELTKLFIAGDEVAFAEVYDRFFSVLYVHALNRIRSKEEAKDIVQDLFVSLWNKRQAADLSNLSNYLFTAVRNRIINLISHKNVESRYLMGLPKNLILQECLTDHRLRERQLAEIITREVAHLPSKMREVFEMSRSLNLSHREISQQLGITEQSVRSHVKNALKILRSRLGMIFYLF
ncbi:RNA polymerase sigma factor [Pedobacter sp. BMA]|uniref:RNA polymerase sigma factor n=1 Tax=Pedobacter sp. BMA TaxID=1663685 RepID=UPI00064B5629|nr:RNA polymerase sigma-70 factor [Pedobacter sp. BMA]KLT67069.1 RNA polymerase sigma 70 [Pedobacter sp. BMA]